MRVLLSALWEFLTHEKFRVKIKTFSDGRSIYYPQSKFRIFPVWTGWSDYMSGSVCYHTIEEANAFNYRRKNNNAKNVLKKVEYKYEE